MLGELYYGIKETIQRRINRNNQREINKINKLRQMYKTGTTKPDIISQDERNEMAIDTLHEYIDRIVNRKINVDIIEEKWHKKTNHAAGSITISYLESL